MQKADCEFQKTSVVDRPVEAITQELQKFIFKIKSLYHNGSFDNIVGIKI